ncbi:MAG: EVE domain-containing protein [Planctomycetales bacterium]|nr:EVE domain-containing protein [Planctomycetales bacterium]
MAWFLLADPTDFGFAELERREVAPWDGIKGAPAQKNLRSARRGDAALVYETAPVKALVGLAELVSDPYPDPSDRAGKRVVVDVRAVRRLRTPVPLAALLGARGLAKMSFVRVKRVAVSPVSAAEEKILLRLAGEAR